MTYRTIQPNQTYSSHSLLRPVDVDLVASMLWSEVSVLMCGKPELLDRCCVHQTRGLSVFGNSRQRRDAVQALCDRCFALDGFAPFLWDWGETG